MASTAQELADRFTDALKNMDMDAMEALYQDDAVQEWPQSGERLAGKTNIMAVNRNYPGMPQVDVRNITAAGDQIVAEIDLNYDGDRYFGVTIVKVKDGKIARQTDYFAQPFEAPEWRAQWVEKM